MLILHFHNSFLFWGLEQPGFVFKLPIPVFRMYTLLFLCMLHPNMLLWSAKKKKKNDVITSDKRDVTHNTVSADLIFPHCNIDNMLSICVWQTNHDACVGELVISRETVQIKLHPLYVPLIWIKEGPSSAKRYLDGMCTRRQAEIIQGHVTKKKKHFVG